MNLERRISQKGGFTVPAELRYMLGIQAREKIELIIQPDGDILLHRATGACVFCGGQEDLKMYEKRFICAECRKTVGALGGGGGHDVE